MKKIVMTILTGMLIISLTACGDKKTSKEYASAVDVLKMVSETGKEIEFPYIGGDFEHAKEDEPGIFDIDKKDELPNLGLPESEFDHIEEAASMMHMMNANIFTSAVYKIKDDVKIDPFVDNVKNELSGRQWLCGAPEKMLIMKVSDEYVLTAFGEEKVLDEFKAKAVKALDGAKISVEAPIE